MEEKKFERRTKTIVLIFYRVDWFPLALILNQTEPVIKERVSAFWPSLLAAPKALDSALGMTQVVGSW